MKFRLTPDDVVDDKTFAEFARQQLGAPKPKSKEWGGFRKELKKLRANHPQCTWPVMTRGVAVMKEAEIRPKTPMTVLWFIDKYIAEDRSLTVEAAPDLMREKINAAVQEETDPEWRLRLLSAEGSQRRDILDQWMLERG